jgi:hypothetical protein
LFRSPLYFDTVVWTGRSLGGSDAGTVGWFEDALTEQKGNLFLLGGQLRLTQMPRERGGGALNEKALSELKGKLAGWPRRFGRRKGVKKRDPG